MKNALQVFVILIAATSSHAQDTTRFNFKFNHLALSVKDVDRSAAFYMKVFQLPEITNRTAAAGIRWISMGDGNELHLVSSIKEPIVVNKALHLSLATKNIDAFAKRLATLNIPYSNWPGEKNTVTVRADGVKQIYFQDPDGYWIEVNNGYVGKK